MIYTKISEALFYNENSLYLFFSIFYTEKFLKCWLSITTIISDSRNKMTNQNTSSITIGHNMLLGKVIGRLVATQKLSAFIGIKFLLVQPLDENQNEIGTVLVACDTAQAGEGDTVWYETNREASIPLPDQFNPSDATITAIVDQIHKEE